MNAIKNLPTKPAGRPASTVRHENKRLAILRTAAQLFAQHGYEATSLDLIADELGMHKATLYHYIKGKEEILYLCLAKSFADLDAVVERMHDHTVPPLTRLCDFTISLAHAQNNDFGRCMALVGLRPLAASQPSSDLHRLQHRLDTIVRDLVTEGIAVGDIRPTDPGLFSAMLFGMLNWVPQWYREGGRLTIDEVVDSYMNALIHGIEARKGC